MRVHKQANGDYTIRLDRNDDVEELLMALSTDQPVEAPDTVRAFLNGLRNGLQRPLSSGVL